MTRPEDIPAILDQLCATYDASAAALRDALAAYVGAGTRPDQAARAEGCFAYPELRLTYTPEGAAPRVSRAFARVADAGTYSVSIARPRLFRPYLQEQLELLARNSVTGSFAAPERKAQLVAEIDAWALAAR